MESIVNEPSKQKYPALGRSRSPSPKVTDDHLALGAALYIRQSTMHQLREHQESTARQYQLKERLISLGWHDEQVITIDDDLGVSGSAPIEMLCPCLLSSGFSFWYR